MRDSIRIAFFGSSLVSAYWNGAATYYRGILKYLSRKGYRITFYEPDAYDRQRHRDIPDPEYAEVRVYPAEEQAVGRMLAEAADAEIVVKASGVGVFDRLLEREVPGLGGAGRKIVFWDVDAPATLERMQADPADPFRELVGRYDLVLTYGGGAPVTGAYEAFGAKRCVPVYNALDPETHYPVPKQERFSADLGFLGNRMPDREERTAEFFFKPARLCPDRRFILGGSGWENWVPELSNLTRLGHVYTADHNAFNRSVRLALNISRASMARFGFSPATRVFEAAGAAACIVTDSWEGLRLFLEPGSECLEASTGEEVAEYVKTVSPADAGRIGRAARERILSEHTYAQRAEQLDRILRSEPATERRIGR